MKLDITHISIVPGVDSNEANYFARIMAGCLADHLSLMRFTVESGVVANGIRFLVVAGRNPSRHIARYNGIHRLTRISPFDEERRRHTSFCGIYVAGLPVERRQVFAWIIHPYECGKNLLSGAEVGDELGVIRAAKKIPK